MHDDPPDIAWVQTGLTEHLTHTAKKTFQQIPVCGESLIDCQHARGGSQHHVRKRAANVDCKRMIHSAALPWPKLREACAAACSTCAICRASGSAVIN